jgi:outer membrane usher protein
VTNALGAMLVVVLLAMPLGPARADSLPASALRPVVYAVEVNGVRVSAGALLLAASQHDLYARIDDLREWRVNVPAGLAEIVHSAVPYVALREIPGVSVAFDAAAQTLLLRVRQSALRGTDVRLGGLAPSDVAPPAGAYADYALTQSGGSYGSALAGEIQAGVAAFGGVVQNDVAWTPGLFSRLQTSWERHDARRMQTLVVGDTTTTDTKLGSALRFAGVRWSSDFNEQPQFSTYPGVTIRGAASVPSTLDISVNGALALQRDVPAGPYALRDLPLLDGAGTIAVRSADALGGVAQFTVPYYAARQLLKPGLVAFSYGAGFLDENGAYGPFLIDASRRWGISDSLTGGAMAQFGARDGIVGADADWLAGRAGVVSLAAAASHGAAGGGALWDLGFDSAGRRLTGGGDVRVASAGYTSLDPTALAIGREIDLHVGLRLTRATSAQVSVARDNTIAGPVTLWTAGLAGSTGGTPYSVTAYKTAGAGAQAFGITWTWSIPVGRRATLSPRVGSGENSAQSQLEYAGSASSGARSVVWDVAAGLTHQAASTAHVMASGGAGEFDVDAASMAGSSDYTTRFAGGLAMLGGTLAETREITGSYGLVRVPGFGGVDVYVNERYAGKTDARGNLLTADLVPYVENEIRIDPSRLAASAHVDALERTVVPTAFGGTTIVFAAREEIEARLTLRTSDGTPLPPGTIVHRVGGDATWPVGLDGHVDLIDLAPGPLLLRAGEAVPGCLIRLVIPAAARITTLPDARCEDAPQQQAMVTAPL